MRVVERLLDDIDHGPCWRFHGLMKALYETHQEHVLDLLSLDRQLYTLPDVSIMRPCHKLRMCIGPATRSECVKALPHAANVYRPYHTLRMCIGPATRCV